MLKSIQEIAREYSLEYETKAEQNAAFNAYCEAYRRGYEDKNQRDNWDLSFIPVPFQKTMIEWLLYKKGNKQSYKGIKPIEKCFKRLYELANGEPEIASQIVDQSIANNWAGLFSLKNNGNKHYKDTEQRNDASSIFRQAESILEGN